LLDPRYLQVLEKLTTAWAKNQKVQIWYRSTEGGIIKEYDFCPYFIEVGAVGQAIYSIGKIEPVNEMRTFKIERVERIELLNDIFAVPTDINPGKLLGRAWGIWYTDDEPVEVVLKFSKNVAPRVRETRWHPGEQVVPMEDGTS
jgi:predicted DNA-binding transcriptional regulator YafY